jgi:HD-GYP domain-containing protein (c-di-GMP phosphodiesterase class II)
MSASEMYEISDDPDILNKYSDMDVYFKNDGHYGLYKKKGAVFDPSRIEFGKLPEQLYISISDRVHLVRHQTQQLNRKLAMDLKKDPVKAKMRLSEVVAVSLSEPRNEVLEDMKDTIGIIVDEYLNSADVIKNLIQVSIKDYTTQLHLTNVMLFCLGYANFAGYDEDDLRLFGLIGLLHDVGKVDIPDEILNAPRKLTDEEFDRVKLHAQNSWKILRQCKFDKRIPICALEHHERLDGSGYPKGKKASDLGPHSRALAIADVYEALTTWRPYKEPMLPLKALGIMREEVESGKLDGNIFKGFAKSIVRLTG